MRHSSILAAYRKRSVALTLSTLVIFCVQVFADPAWWSTRSALSADTPHPTGGVTLGQLKFFSARAIDELNAQLPGGAGEPLNQLAASWRATYLAHGTVPPAPDPADMQLVAVGQGKYIASLIHQRLFATGQETSAPAWLEVTPTDSALLNQG